MIKILKQFINKREIYRVHAAHTVRAIALSMISIYIPIYLLTLNYSLSEVIIFYAIFHISGLLFVLFVVVPVINKYDLIHAFKLYYPIEILFYLLLYLLPKYSISIWVIAIFGGMALFTYYVPLNILLIKHAKYDKMGSDLAAFFALPKIFKIVGPLIAAVLIMSVGFGVVFIIAMMGVLLSFIPIFKIKRDDIKVNIKIQNIFRKLKERKKIFILEIFDNILEESEWFWGIYVFLLIGSLYAPGIVGSLAAIGSAIFLFFVGKIANKKDYTLVIFGAGFIFIISILRLYINLPINAYIITIISSFAMALFLVSYTSVIYRKIKDKKDEEFIVLREIPTVFGRLIVFCGILVTINYQQYFFILPAIVSLAIFLIFILKDKFEMRTT